MGNEDARRIPTLAALLEKDPSTVKGDDRVRCPVCVGKAEAQARCRFCRERGYVTVIALACEAENRLREGPCEDEEDICDECGADISGLELVNDQHADSCSLFDENLVKGAEGFVLEAWTRTDGLEKYAGNRKPACLTEEDWQTCPDNPESRYRWCEASELCSATVAKEDGKVCWGCRTNPKVTKGWAIFNNIHDLPRGQYEIQADDSSTIFDSDEEAARAHFEEVTVHDDGVRTVVLARRPKTPEARYAAARHRRGEQDE